MGKLFMLLSFCLFSISFNNIYGQMYIEKRVGAVYCAAALVDDVDGVVNFVSVSNTDLDDGHLVVRMFLHFVCNEDTVTYIKQLTENDVNMHIKLPYSYKVTRISIVTGKKFHPSCLSDGEQVEYDHVYAYCVHRRKVRR